MQFPKLLYTSFIVSGCVKKNKGSKLSGSFSSLLPFLSTVKQGILYWTCTGPDADVIGLAPTRD